MFLSDSNSESFVQLKSWVFSLFKSRVGSPSHLRSWLGWKHNIKMKFVKFYSKNAVFSDFIFHCFWHIIASSMLPNFLFNIRLFEFYISKSIKEFSQNHLFCSVFAHAKISRLKHYFLDYYIKICSFYTMLHKVF